MANVEGMTMNPPQNRLVGGLPKIGIRPAIDGRRRGVREGLENQTMAMARAVAELLSGSLRHANGLPVECVIADTLHRRGGRSCPDCRQVRPRGRRRLAHRDPVLVLRVGDHGHGPVPAQGRLGLQRHRAPGRRVPGRRAGGPQSEGPAGFRYLRARRPGLGRPEHPGRREGEAPAVRPRRPGRGDDARQVVPVHGRRVHGHRRLDRRPGFLRELPGHARGIGRHVRVHAPLGRSHLR